MSRWKQISSKQIYQTPWFSVREDAVITPDGNDGTYSVIDSQAPAVFVVALTDRNELYLIKQFRYPTQREGWELPAGNTEGEDPVVAAQRELGEEAGLAADRWEEIGTFDSMNSFCNERCHVMLGQGLQETGSDAQAEEGITDVKAVSLAEARAMMTAGEIHDGQTMAALLLLEEHLNPSDREGA